MRQAFRLILILALSFGAMTAPDVSAVNAAEVSMAQMDAAESTDDHCGGRDPTEFDDGVSCVGGCPVPCGVSSTAGILVRMPSGAPAMALGNFIPATEPVFLIGANPLLDPFPPKQPI